MAYRCALCGKGILHGQNVSHSKRRTKRVFKPNLHRARILVSGQMKKMWLCTKCLRIAKAKMRKEQMVVKASPVKPAAAV